MRQPRTECSQGWVKVLAVPKNGDILPSKLLPFRNCVKHKRSVCPLQNENVRFEQSRNVRFHRWPRALWKRSELL
jgi:hypothetical protein